MKNPFVRKINLYDLRDMEYELSERVRYIDDGYDAKDYFMRLVFTFREFYLPAVKKHLASDKLSEKSEIDLFLFYLQIPEHSRTVSRNFADLFVGLCDIFFQKRFAKLEPQISALFPPTNFWDEDVDMTITFSCWHNHYYDRRMYYQKMLTYLPNIEDNSYNLSACVDNIFNHEVREMEKYYIKLEFFQHYERALIFAQLYKSALHAQSYRSN